MKRNKRWVGAFIAASLLIGNAIPQTAFAANVQTPEPVQDMTVGENPKGVGDSTYDFISKLGWNKAEGKSVYTNHKRIQFEDLGGVNGQDAKITFRCAADEDTMLHLLSLMIGEESEFSYLELAMKIGNGSNFALIDGTRTIRVQYDGKIDFTTTILFFNYGYNATPVQMTEFIEPVLAPEPVATPVPTVKPTIRPTVTVVPTVIPTPTDTPMEEPSIMPMPTVIPTVLPTAVPTLKPTVLPTAVPTLKPTVPPTAVPTLKPTMKPTATPTLKPTVKPTNKPVVKPTPTVVTVGTVKNVTVTNIKKNQFMVNWKQIKGAAGYEVYLREKGKTKYTKVVTVSSDVKKVVVKKLGKKELASGTTYEIVVRAYKKSGTKNIYGAYSKSVITSTMLQAPSVSVKSSKGKLEIGWKSDKKVEGYEVYLSINKNKGYKKQAVVPAKKAKMTTKKLTLKKTYYVKVRAYKTINGKKTYSNYSTVKKIVCK